MDTKKGGYESTLACPPPGGQLRYGMADVALLLAFDRCTWWRAQYGTIY